MNVPLFEARMQTPDSTEVKSDLLLGTSTLSGLSTSERTFIRLLEQVGLAFSEVHSVGTWTDIRGFDSFSVEAPSTSGNIGVKVDSSGRTLSATVPTGNLERTLAGTYIQHTLYRIYCTIMAGRFAGLQTRGLVIGGANMDVVYIPPKPGKQAPILEEQAPKPEKYALSLTISK